MANINLNSPHATIDCWIRLSFLTIIIVPWFKVTREKIKLQFLVTFFPNFSQFFQQNLFMFSKFFHKFWKIDCPKKKKMFSFLESKGICTSLRTFFVSDFYRKQSVNLYGTKWVSDSHLRIKFFALLYHNQLKSKAMSCSGDFAWNLFVKENEERRKLQQYFKAEKIFFLLIGKK